MRHLQSAIRILTYLHLGAQTAPLLIEYVSVQKGTQTAPLLIEYVSVQKGAQTAPLLVEYVSVQKVVHNYGNTSVYTLTMKRILIVECKQEVSTFNPVASGYDDFMVRRADAMLAYHRATRNEVGGALAVFDVRQDVTVQCIYSALAITSGGTLAADALKRITTEMVESLRAAPVADAVYFCLHGAMAASGEDDPEGHLLQMARAVLGERIPIVASFDLHGVLTDRILRECDAIVCYHTYPHIDFYETGQRAAITLLKVMDGSAKPVTARVFVPALVRGDELITASGAIRHPVQAAQAVEASAGGLSAGLFWGNPFTDVVDLGSNAFVVVDGDAGRAAREALHIAELFWRDHERMRVPLTGMAEAAQLAKSVAAGTGTTILVDAADATSSGASGDSNAIVRALLEADYRGTVLAPVVDPGAVRDAFAAGVGAQVHTHIGGALDTTCFRPLDVDAQVKLLSDGQLRSESFGEVWEAGPSAVLRAGSITWVVTTRPVSLYDRTLFYACGQDPRHFDAVIVKSPQCQPHMFRTWAARYVDVDAPGSTSANLLRLGHTRCARPMFPLDADVPFVPQVQVFSRPT